MSNDACRTSRPLMLAFALVLVMAGTSMVCGQDSGALNTGARVTNVSSVPSGAKMKFKGVVIRRDADTFTVRDRSRVDYQVLLTDETSIKTYGGFFRGGKRYPVTDVMPGLILEVEGRGNNQGQLVADKVRFKESDMRAAITTDARVMPIEENQKQLAGQMDELYAVAAEARAESAQANERINSLDDYDAQEVVVVNFRVNSAVLSVEAKQKLDALAATALNTRGYIIEVAGHTDATGGDAKNFRLSQERADAVVQYLAVQHKIPLRRFISPMGYGKTEAVADNVSAAGRAQNRRVEVKVLINRGMSKPAQRTSQNNP